MQLPLSLPLPESSWVPVSSRVPPSPPHAPVAVSVPLALQEYSVPLTQSDSPQAMSETVLPGPLQVQALGVEEEEHAIARTIPAVQLSNAVTLFIEAPGKDW
jgi:hypothetical protein